MGADRNLEARIRVFPGEREREPAGGMAGVVDEATTAGLSEPEISEAFRRHAGELFGFFAHRTGDSAASEDLVQDTFLRAMTYRSSFGRRGSVRAWLYTIARNLLRDRPARPPMDELPPQLPEAGHDLLEVAVARDELERTQRALGRLRPEQSEVLVLTRLQGLSQREVGEILGISEGAVKLRVFRALAALRDSLRRDGVDHDL
jgi:RNA polymerase sigma factor (sigma-70 family)